MLASVRGNLFYFRPVDPDQFQRTGPVQQREMAELFDFR
jgi:hypothetical protein